MSPFLKIMQLFLMMTGTVLGMLLLLLVTPDIEDSLLRAVARHQRRRHAQQDTPLFVTSIPARVTAPQLTERAKGGIDMSVELDRNRKSYTPWPNSEDCHRYRINFARHKSLPMTALVSFPGSGNTWVRYLIEAATGVFTGSVYEDRVLISKGAERKRLNPSAKRYKKRLPAGLAAYVAAPSMYGEVAPIDCGCTMVQKTHGSVGNSRRSLAVMKTFQRRGVLILRNPYDALLSYRNYISGGHTGFAPHDSFTGPGWDVYVTKMSSAWRNLAATWINCTIGSDAMMIHYEHLRMDPRRDLRSLLHYLGVAVDDNRLNCVLKHIDGQFKRQASSAQKMWFSTKDPFTKKQHKLIDMAIQHIDKLLKDRGWERIPIYLYKFYSKQRISWSSNIENFTLSCT